MSNTDNVFIKRYTLYINSLHVKCIKRVTKEVIVSLISSKDSVLVRRIIHSIIWDYVSNAESAGISFGKGVKGFVESKLKANNNNQSSQHQQKHIISIGDYYNNRLNFITNQIVSLIEQRALIRESEKILTMQTNSLQLTYNLRQIVKLLVKWTRDTISNVASISGINEMQVD